MQKFFETTTLSTFIKYLLSCNPLPIYPTINTDEYMVAGITYIYKHDILRCVESGRFNGIKPDTYRKDYLYVSEDTFVSDDDNIVKHLRYNEESRTYDWVYLQDETGRTGGLTVTDDMIEYSYLPIADYEIVGHYDLGNFYPNITKQFVSNVNYYDSQTHRALGDYLRCLRDLCGVDLMSLYNCFDYTTTDNIHINSDGVIEESDSKTKVILVPIKYNKTYTIAIDCSFPVYISPVLYNGKHLITDINNESMSDAFKQYITKFNSLNFITPETIKVENSVSSNIDYSAIDYNATDAQKQVERAILSATQKSVKYQECEKYLYLAIQLPASNTSSIVVLEGDYVSTAEEYVTSAQYVSTLGEPFISRLFRSNLSLLHSNDQIQHPFSDKLSEYLLRYTIDDREYIDDNVLRVQEKIGFAEKFRDSYSGVWDDDLRYALYKTYMQLPDYEWLDKDDILGYVDLDIENAINRNQMTIKTAAERGLQPYYGN